MTTDVREEISSVEAKAAEDERNLAACEVSGRSREALQLELMVVQCQEHLRAVTQILEQLDVFVADVRLLYESYGSDAQVRNLMASAERRHTEQANAVRKADQTLRAHKIKLGKYLRERA